MLVKCELGFAEWAVFLFNKLIYKSLSYASTSVIHPPFLISTWVTTNVSPVAALFYKRMSQIFKLSWVDCSIPLDEEMKDIKVSILANFQSRVRPVGLRCFFGRHFFRSNKGFRLSNCVSTQPRSQSFFRFFGNKSCSITVVKLVSVLNDTCNTSLQWRHLFVQSSLWII